MDELPSLIKNVVRTDTHNSSNSNDQDEQEKDKQEDEIITLAMPMHLASGHVKNLRNLTKAKALVPISDLSWVALGEIDNLFTDRAYPTDQNHTEPTLDGKVSHSAQVLGPLLATAVDAAAHRVGGKHYLQCLFEFLKHSSPTLRDTGTDWLKSKLVETTQEATSTPEMLLQNIDRSDALRWKLVQNETISHHPYELELKKENTLLTVEGFLKLSNDEQDDILFYVENAQSIHVTREQKSNFSDALRYLHAGQQNSVIDICIQELIALYALISPRERQKITPADCNAMDVLDKVKALQLIREHDKLLRPDERLLLSRFARVTNRHEFQALTADDQEKLKQFLVQVFNRLPGDVQSRLNCLSPEQIEELPPNEQQIVCNLAAAKVTEKGTAAEKVRIEQLQAKKSHPDFKTISLCLEKYLHSDEKAVLISSLQTRFAVIQLLPGELDQMIMQIEKTLKSHPVATESTEVKTLRSQLALLKSYQKPVSRRSKLHPQITNKFEMVLAHKERLIKLLCLSGYPIREVETWVSQLGMSPKNQLAAPKMQLMPEHPLLKVIIELGIQTKKKAVKSATSWAAWLSNTSAMSDWIELATSSSFYKEISEAAAAAKDELISLIDTSRHVVEDLPVDFTTLDQFISHTTASARYYEQAAFLANPVASWLYIHGQKIVSLPFIVKNLTAISIEPFAYSEIKRVKKAIQTAEKRIAKLSSNKLFPLSQMIQAYEQEQSELSLLLSSKLAVKTSMQETGIAKKEVLDRLQKEIIDTENGLKLVYFTIQDLKGKHKEILDKISNLQEFKTLWQHIVQSVSILTGQAADNFIPTMTVKRFDPVITTVTHLVLELLEGALFAQVEEYISRPVQFQRQVRSILDRLENALRTQREKTQSAKLFTKLKERMLTRIAELEDIEQQNVERAKEKLSLLARRQEAMKNRITS
jgi:hypothetical protein